MTDPWQTVVDQPQQRRRGLTPGTIAAVATGTVVMAVAGLAITTTLGCRVRTVATRIA